MPIIQPYAFGCWYGYDQDCVAFDFTASMNVGNWTAFGNQYYGFIDGDYGAMNDQDFDGNDIIRFGWTNDNGGEVFLWFDSFPYPNWSNITINGTSFPQKSSWTSGFAQFKYSTSTNPFGTSGFITITAVY